MSRSLADSLQRGVATLGIPLSAAQSELLLAYLALLERWNRAYNLTAVRDPAQMVPRHLLDSLSIAPLVRGSRLLDVGSGAGLPGLVLAVALPQLQITLLDPALKRTRFLSHAVRELGLPNVTVERARMQQWRPALVYDTVTSRATAGLDALLAGCAPLVAANGRLIAMLGKLPSDIEAAIPAGWALRTEVLAVPGVEGERHAAVLSRRD